MAETAKVADPRAKIEIRKVSLQFAATGRSESLLVLDNVSVDVRENEVVCVMGPSGCGKTTLLSVVAGLRAPSGGELLIGGRPISGPGPDRAVVFQADAVFPWMTVEDNIAYSPRAQGKSAAETTRIVDRYLDLVNLTAFRHHWPRQLSGGMRKRVDVARAYAANPDVLLMDEPFGALDIMTKERLHVELQRLWLQEPHTMLFITHDLEEALFIGDRVVVMSPRPGRVDSVYEVPFSRPRDLSIKMTPAFVALRKEISDIFRHYE